MKKIIIIGKGKAHAWFDAECRVTRKELRHHLRKYHKGNTDYERLQYNQKRIQRTVKDQKGSVP